MKSLNYDQVLELLNIDNDLVNKKMSQSFKNYLKNAKNENKERQFDNDQVDKILKDTKASLVYAGHGTIDGMDKTYLCVKPEGSEDFKDNIYFEYTLVSKEKLAGLWRDEFDLKAVKIGRLPYLESREGFVFMDGLTPTFAKSDNVEKYPNYLNVAIDGDGDIHLEYQDFNYDFVSYVDDREIVFVVTNDAIRNDMRNFIDSIKKECIRVCRYEGRLDLATKCWSGPGSFDVIMKSNVVESQDKIIILIDLESRAKYQIEIV